MANEKAEAIRHGIDWASAGVVLGAMAEWLPPLAAGMAILWHLYRFYETWQRNRVLARERDYYVDAVAGWHKQPRDNFTVMPGEELKRQYLEINKRKSSDQ